MSPASPEPVPLPAPATTRGEKALLVALAGLVFLAPLVILRGNFDAANLPQSAFIALGALALLCLWLWRSSPVFRLPRLLILPPSLALLAWSALSLLWAANRYEGAVVLLHWSACALVGVLTAARVREPREARLVLLGLFGAGLSVALLGTLQHLTGFSAIPQGFPPAATFVNKNMAAQFVIMVLPVGLALALETPRLGALVFYWGSALMGAYVFYTRTRSAWLALAAEALLLVLFRRHLGQSTKGRGLALVGSLALLALLVHLGPLGFVRGPSAAYQDLVKPWLSSAPPAGAPPAATILSVQERIAIWRNTLAMIRDAPLLGVGLGNHPVQYPRYAHRVVVDPLFSPTLQLDYVHNDYLQVGAELGLVGLLLSLWFGIALVRTFRSSEAAAPPGWTGLGLGLFVGIAGVLVDALFSFPFYRAVPPLVIMVAVGLAAGVGRPSERTLILSPGLSRLLLGLGLLALAATTWLEVRWVLADRHIHRMIEAESRHDHEGVLAEAQSAHRENPHRKEPLFFAGSAWLALGEPRRAAEALHEEVSAYPYDLTALGNLGLAYAGSGEYSLARDCDRRVIELQPGEAVIHARLAVLDENLGDKDDALAESRLAVRFDPRNALYQYRRGILALRARSFDEAEEALGASLALDPRSAVAHKALGVVLVNRGRTGEGVEHFRRALALSPDLPDAAHMRDEIERYERSPKTPH